MAEGQTGILKRLKSEVTCPLCLDIFSEPKKFPCDHIYCKLCLRGLALRSIDGTISCPECRVSVPIPSNGVTGFQAAHQVNRLLEIYQESSSAEAAKPQRATCEVHMSQPLALYCETCEKLVCRDCALTSCAKDHKYDYIAEMVRKYDSDINSEMEPVRGLCQELLSSLNSLSISKKELHQDNEKALQEIRRHFKMLSEILVKEEKHFVEVAEASFREQLNLYSSKEEELTETLAKLEAVVLSVDTAPRNESFLLNVADTKQSIKQGKETAKEALASRPKKLPEIATNLVSVKEFEEMTVSKNFVYAKSDPLKCHTDRKSDTTFAVKEEAHLKLHLLQNTKTGPFKKSPLTAQLHCWDESFSQIVTVKKVTSETFLLSFTPQSRGVHSLHVRLNDNFVRRIPIYVTMPPHMLTMLSSLQIYDVAGVKFHCGKIYATQLEESVVVVNSRLLTVEATVEIPGVSEMLVNYRHIYATDYLKDRLIKMNMNGTILASTGTKGDGPGQFNLPNGVRLSKDNELYVCDSENHRIQVFDLDFKLVRILGQKGTAGGCLNWPADLDFDEDGNVYVADVRNNRVQVLSRQGQHICNIGRPGLGQGELHRPVSVAVHRGKVYVTESTNKRVSVFKLSGEFVSTFGENILMEPECITIDENGFVYVSDQRKRIVKF